LQVAQQSQGVEMIRRFVQNALAHGHGLGKVIPLVKRDGMLQSA
jgi:hypothetical protein